MKKSNSINNARFAPIMLLLTFSFVAMPPSPASAQFAEDLSKLPVKRDEVQLAGVYQLATDPQDSGSVKLRGGSKSGKPLGLYGIGNADIVFKSDYKDMDPKLQAEFAVDLYTFIKTRGGGIDNYRNSLGGKTGTFVALTAEQRVYKPEQYEERNYVPFKYQEEFGRGWWTRYNEKFKKIGFLWKDGFLYDAVLDANSLILRYEELNGKGSADYGSWADVIRAWLIQKK